MLSRDRVFRTIVGNGPVRSTGLKVASDHSPSRRARIINSDVEQVGDIVGQVYLPCIGVALLG